MNFDIIYIHDMRLISPLAVYLKCSLTKAWPSEIIPSDRMLYQKKRKGSD